MRINLLRWCIVIRRRIQGRNHGFKVGGPSAEGADGGGAWGGGAPLAAGEGVWGGGRAPPPENVLTFYLKMVSFGAFWVVLPCCM